MLQHRKLSTCVATIPSSAEDEYIKKSRLTMNIYGAPEVTFPMPPTTIPILTCVTSRILLSIFVWVQCILDTTCECLDSYQYSMATRREKYSNVKTNMCTIFVKLKIMFVTQKQICLCSLAFQLFVLLTSYNDSNFFYMYRWVNEYSLQGYSGPQAYNNEI